MGLFAYIDCQFTACGVVEDLTADRPIIINIVEEFDICRSLCRATKRISFVSIHRRLTDNRHGRNSHNAAGALVCRCTGTRSDFVECCCTQNENRIELNGQSQLVIHVRDPETCFSYSTGTVLQNPDGPIH